MTNKQFLQWIHDRLRYEHGENIYMDYMHKLRAIIEATPQVTDEQIDRCFAMHGIIDSYGFPVFNSISHMHDFARAISAPPAAEPYIKFCEYEAFTEATRQVKMQSAELQEHFAQQHAAAPQEAKLVAADSDVCTDCDGKGRYVIHEGTDPETGPYVETEGCEVCKGTGKFTIADQLREYAGNSGYSHQDYADVMVNAADEIERLRAVSPQEQAPVVDRDAVIEEVAKHVWQYKAAGVIPSWLMLEISGICKYIRDMQSQPQQVKS